MYKYHNNTCWNAPSEMDLTYLTSLRSISDANPALMTSRAPYIADVYFSAIP